MKTMCWCKWKGSPIWIPFIFEWYFKLQKNELIAKYCYLIGSGTWPDLWLKWICNGSQRWRWCVDVNEKDLQFRFHSFLNSISNYKKMSLLPNIVIELAVELDQIFGWSVSANGSQRRRWCVDVNEKDLQFRFHSFLHGISNYKKNELVAKYCYWIGSGTWPDLWLKWICQWIPKMKTMCWCKWKGSPIWIPFIFEWYFKLQKNELVAKYCYWIGSGTWPDLWLKWESANGSQRWRWCVDVNEKDLNSDSIHFWMVFQITKKWACCQWLLLNWQWTWPDLWLKWICQWIPKMKMMCWCKWKASPIWIPFIFEWYFKLQKMSLLPMIVIELAVELDQIFCWSESANGSQRWRWCVDVNEKHLQFGFHSFLNGISNYKKMCFVANDCYWIGSGTGPDLWLKWICQWIPKMKMMCWCKWKGSPIWIPFIFEWYFKLQKNELVANDCYWIGSGTWPDLWLKWICQWIPKMTTLCWCKWKGSPIWIPFIFEWYFKLQKNELVAKYCYWIGSGTRPDLWLKWICQWIPKMKMMCWCKWKESPIRDSIHFCMVFQITKKWACCQILLLNWQWNLTRSLVEVNLPMDTKEEDDVFI